MTSESRHRLPRRLSMVLACVLIATGAAASGYLLWRHITIVAGNTAGYDICGAVFGSSCDETMRSDWAVALGIPLAGWGLVHFSVVAALLGMCIAHGRAFRVEGLLAGLLLCTGASLYGVILTSMMLAGTAPYCPLCVLIHAANVLLVPLLFAVSGKTVGQLWRTLWHGMKYLFGAHTAEPALARWKGTGFAAVGLVGVTVFQWVLIEVDRHRLDTTEAPSFADIQVELQVTPVQEIAVTEDDPVLGDRDASVQLVVFSDFACPACRRLAHTLDHVRSDHPEISIAFKHFPLCKQCNPEAESNLHPGSCQVAYAAEAARRQGRFWAYHDALFATSDQLDDSKLVAIAKQLQLDVQRFEADRTGSAAKAKVRADISAGKAVDIPGTPTVLLNGRKVSAHGMDFLQELIHWEAVAQ